MWTEQDFREIDDAAWDIRIYLDVMLGYLRNYDGDPHITELIAMAELIHPLVRKITSKF